MSSYSPIYFQPIIWVAKLLDGSIIREWDDEGKVTPFKSLDKSKLAEFHMISKDYDYFFDCKTGIFVADGREFIFPLAGSNLPFNEGLIEYKEASTHFVPAVLKTDDYDGFGIDSFNFGWKITYGNIKCQVILSLPEKVFTVDMTLLDIQKTITWKVKI
jgi:hypothetical protein